MISNESLNCDVAETAQKWSNLNDLDRFSVYPRTECLPDLPNVETSLLIDVTCSTVDWPIAVFPVAAISKRQFTSFPQTDLASSSNVLFSNCKAWSKKIGTKDSGHLKFTSSDTLVYSLFSLSTLPNIKKGNKKIPLSIKLMHKIS